jgi:hypothetical protein
VIDQRQNPEGGGRLAYGAQLVEALAIRAPDYAHLNGNETF